MFEHLRERNGIHRRRFDSRFRQPTFNHQLDLHFRTLLNLLCASSAEVNQDFHHTKVTRFAPKFGPSVKSSPGSKRFLPSPVLLYSHWHEVSEKGVGFADPLSMVVAVHLSLEPALLLVQLAAVPLKPAKVHTTSISLST